MNIPKDLNELIQADLITAETAAKITAYYQNKSGASQNRLFIVFGILGALLVGLGIILIIAHNWDELSTQAKTIFAFLPLLLGQLLCGYTLLKNPDSIALRESSAAFLFCSIGASIALVSQIYNIPGDTAAFVLCWMLLGLPLVYLMKSSVVSLLYIVGITNYATVTGLSSYAPTVSDMYWLLILGVLPHYYGLYRSKPYGNFTLFHHWAIPVSLSIALGTVVKNNTILVVAYISLFALFYMIAKSGTFAGQKTINNGYKILGLLGTLGILLVLSFDGFWKELRSENWQFSVVIISPEFLAAVVTTLLAAAMLYQHKKNRTLSDIKPFAVVFVPFIIIFLIGLVSDIAVVLINLIVFTIGMLTIRDGAKRDHLGILNFGLLIITILVICRFFDSDLSFVIRGLLFVGVGIGFFITNYMMIKKRKRNA